MKSSVTVSQDISVTVTTSDAAGDEAVKEKVQAIHAELLAVRKGRKLNELTLSDINHALRSGYAALKTRSSPRRTAMWRWRRTRSSSWAKSP